MIMFNIFAYFFLDYGFYIFVCGVENNKHQSHIKDMDDSVCNCGYRIQMIDSIYRADVKD